MGLFPQRAFAMLVKANRREEWCCRPSSKGADIRVSTWHPRRRLRSTLFEKMTLSWMLKQERGVSLSEREFVEAGQGPICGPRMLMENKEILIRQHRSSIFNENCEVHQVVISQYIWDQTAFCEN